MDVVIILSFRTGLTQIKMLSSLAELDDVDEILCKMKSISQHLTKQASQQPDSIRCAMHVTSSGLNQARNDLSKFLNDSFLQGKLYAKLVGELSHVNFVFVSL